MCWKWLYNCGHTADIACRCFIRDPNNREHDDLTYYCWGFPDHYTKADAPCLRCLQDKTASRDERGSKDGNNGGRAGTSTGTNVNGNTTNATNATNATNVNGTATTNTGNRSRDSNANPNYKYEGGSGNNTWGANYLGDGWINVDLIGVFPWDKPWMATMAGLKYDENDLLVPDPESTIATETMIVYQNTYEFDPYGKYETFNDELEALSNNPAYARIPSKLTFVRPTDPQDLAFVKNLGYLGTPTSARSFSASTTSSASTSFDATKVIETPTTDLSFASAEVDAQVRIAETEDDHDDGKRSAVVTEGMSSLEF